ncbi:hypothetical protein PV402_40020 [Streptomyces scabiei]|uniref:hypothetical protein n=1 Tax=Streptomyces scabiei TaxID=1930 RepID=UPI0029B8062B|nr:hypothetical protein [Streptomyces scabiei]MDX2658376.1 hypothetical protein [Streptomyces scabiei]MDX2870532.1 hypothetical protein [Streptomyces scabiei]
MAHSSAELAAVYERRAALIRLRREHPKLAFHDEKILALGYPSDSAARKDFYRALEQRRKDLNIEVTAYREEQNEVIEALLETYLPAALDDKDLKAAEMVLKLMERQAKLNGWEAALKAELSGPGGGAVPIATGTIAELRELIRTAGEPDDEDDENPDDADGDTDDDGDTDNA